MMRRQKYSLRRFLMLMATLAPVSGINADDFTRVEVHEATLHVLREVQIAAEVTGTLLHVSPEVEGALVKKDDLLVTLNDELVRAEVDYAETQAAQTTEIEFAEESLELAKANFEQKKAANERKRGVFTPQEMRTGELEVTKAFAQLKKSKDDKILHEKTVNTKKAQLAQYSVKAPFDGQITKIHRYPGQNVRPGDPILTLTDMSVLDAEVKVNIKYRGLLFVGDEVEFEIDLNAPTPNDTASARPANDSEPAESSSTADSLFDTPRSGRTRGPFVAQADEFAPAAATADGTMFRGVIQFIEPQITRNGNVAYVSLSVHVPNPQDDFGRYALQEGIPVKAVVLAKKRSSNR